MIIQFNNVFFRNTKVKIVNFKKTIADSVNYFVDNLNSDAMLFDDGSEILFDDGNTVTT